MSGVCSVLPVSENLNESLKRIVLMEADLARLLEIQLEVEASPAPLDHEASLRIANEVTTRLIANQRQIIESLIMIAEELAALRTV